MQHLNINPLDAILALAETHALQAWVPLNEWLARNIITASDDDLKRALAALHDLAGVVRH